MAIDVHSIALPKATVVAGGEDGNLFMEKARWEQ